MPIVRRKKFFVAERVAGYHINWHEVPLKRCIDMKNRYPDNAMELVTFISEEFLEDAANFLNEARVPFDSMSYVPLERFLQTLRFQSDLLAIYDSDPGRLDRYGQKGHQVQRGHDF
jgi:hypothetical protein